MPLAGLDKMRMARSAGAGPRLITVVSVALGASPCFDLQPFQRQFFGSEFFSSWFSVAGSADNCSSFSGSPFDISLPSELTSM